MFPAIGFSWFRNPFALQMYNGMDQAAVNLSDV